MIMRKENSYRIVLAGMLIIPILCLFTACESNLNQKDWGIKAKGHSITIKAGILERNIEIAKHSATTSSVIIEGNNLINNYGYEFSVTLTKASPDIEPQGIEFSNEAGVEQKESVKNQTDALKVDKKNNQANQNVQWINAVKANGEQVNPVFDAVNYSIEKEGEEVHRLTLTYSSNKNEWEGLSAEVIYETYKGFPAIRKWIRFSNKGKNWIKIEDLVIDDIHLTQSYSVKTLLTPEMRGIDPSIVAFHDPLSSRGVIVTSEVPSKPRKIFEDGGTGYHPDYFEWVLGPSESFESEPVFLYGFSGNTYQTTSSISTALDRCVETDFRTFIIKHILPPTGMKKEPGPVFCTWTNYSANINESNMREAADIASNIGFKYFQLDAGWSDTKGGGWAVSTINPNSNKFPDLVGISDYIRSKGMKTGLWYSVFINEKETLENLKEPLLFSLPLIRRSGGLGLSFCFEPSREKYANEIIYLHKKYKADYFKQDLSDVCYGDIARGHESRTLKESYLRGLRGLFASQDKIHEEAPEAWLQLSHEIYWETPGPEADVAVLKHVDSYHAAPNEYWGAGNRSRLVNSDWGLNADSLKQKLIQGSFRSRKLMYEHRGLPLERIEIFGAVTTNFEGSLATSIQDRQVCSWLMGAPLSYSGDLTSLTEENIERYKDRFEKLEALQKKYGIYSYFQYSGVPAPTDEDWHWWGKLNPEGCGVVVVLRGNSGEESRKINIPWVVADKIYQVKGLFLEKDFGIFNGKQLQEGMLTISLDTYGQEILELSDVM